MFVLIWFTLLMNYCFRTPMDLRWKRFRRRPTWESFLNPTKSLNIPGLCNIPLMAVIDVDTNAVNILPSNYYSQRLEKAKGKIDIDINFHMLDNNLNILHFFSQSVS